MRALGVAILTTAVLLAGCLPNTSHDPADRYAIGLRMYNRARYDDARLFWEPLLEQGDCDAEYWMGRLHFFGLGTPRDVDKAIGLWRKAANANHPKAQWALGDLYFQKDAISGHPCDACGIEKDLVQAYVWYKLFEKSARYDGEKKASVRALMWISGEMSREQLTRAEQGLVEWKPTPTECRPRHWW